jgi:hypothetical protein
MMPLPHLTKAVCSPVSGVAAAAVNGAIPPDRRR